MELIFHKSFINNHKVLLLNMGESPFMRNHLVIDCYVAYNDKGEYILFMSDKLSRQLLKERLFVSFHFLLCFFVELLK